MKEQLRESWVDAILVVLTFMMLASSWGDNIAQTARVPSEYKTYGTVFHSLLRARVPLFVMLSGYLFLIPGKLCGMDVCYQHRITHAAVLFLIWATVYGLFPWPVSRFGGGLPVARLFLARADGGLHAIPLLALSSIFVLLARIPWGNVAVLRCLPGVYRLTGSKEG